MCNFPQNTTCRTCQRTWDRDNDRYLDTDGNFRPRPTASEMHQEKATERPATTASEAVSRAEAALKAAEMAGLAEDIITTLKNEISRIKQDQLKQRGKQLDAAKTSLTHDDQAKSGSGSGGSKSRSGQGNAPDCVSEISKMCIADSERTTSHAHPEWRGRICENSNRSGCSDR